MLNGDEIHSIVNTKPVKNKLAQISMGSKFLDKAKDDKGQTIFNKDHKPANARVRNVRFVYHNCLVTQTYDGTNCIDNGEHKNFIHSV